MEAEACAPAIKSRCTGAIAGMVLTLYAWSKVGAVLAGFSAAAASGPAAIASAVSTGSPPPPAAPAAAGPLGNAPERLQDWVEGHSRSAVGGAVPSSVCGGEALVDHMTPRRATDHAQPGH